MMGVMEHSSTIAAAALLPSCGMNNVMLRTFVVRTQELHRLGKSFCARRLGTATYADRAENVPRGMQPRWVDAEQAEAGPRPPAVVGRGVGCSNDYFWSSRFSSPLPFGASPLGGSTLAFGSAAGG